MKYIQTSIDQTGIAIFSDGERIPLFSEDPISEAQKILEKLSKSNDELQLKNVFITNNLLDVKIEDLIAEYTYSRPEVLPEDLMDELLSGFPGVQGNTTVEKIFFS